MSNFSRHSNLFKHIYSKELGTKEGEYTQAVIDSLETNDKNKFNDTFAKKVGNRSENGESVDLEKQKEEFTKLAQVVKKLCPNKIGPKFDDKFLVPFDENVTQDQLNEQTCRLMSFVGMECEEATKLPEFDVVRYWVKLDYSTMRCLYG
jgi:hypothetical protein